MTRALWEVTVAWEAGVKRRLSSDEGRHAHRHELPLSFLFSQLSLCHLILWPGEKKNKDAVFCILNFKSLAGEMVQG